jgi:cell division protein FtsB
MIVVLGFVVCVMLTDSLFGEKGLLALARTRQQHQALAAEVARATAINARLREQIRRTTDDPTAIEELGRRELGLIKPGEKLFIIRDVPPAGTAR